MQLQSRLAGEPRDERPSAPIPACPDRGPATAAVTTLLRGLEAPQFFGDAEPALDDLDFQTALFWCNRIGLQRDSNGRTLVSQRALPDLVELHFQLDGWLERALIERLGPITSVLEVGGGCGPAAALSTPMTSSMIEVDPRHEFIVPSLDVKPLKLTWMRLETDVRSALPFDESSDPVWDDIVSAVTTRLATDRIDEETIIDAAPVEALALANAGFLFARHHHLRGPAIGRRLELDLVWGPSSAGCDTVLSSWTEAVDTAEQFHQRLSSAIRWGRLCAYALQAVPPT